MWRLVLLLLGRRRHSRRARGAWLGIVLVLWLLRLLRCCYRLASWLSLGVALDIIDRCIGLAFDMRLVSCVFGKRDRALRWRFVAPLIYRLIGAYLHMLVMIHMIFSTHSIVASVLG